MNPYAPTAHVNVDVLELSLRESDRVSHARVIFSVIGAVAGAGGLFILVIGFVAAGAMFIAESGFPSVAWLWLVLGLSLYGVIGMLAVGAVAAIVVPLSCVVFGGFDLFGSRNWDRRAIKNFAILCGFSTGWFCGVLLSGFALIGAGLGLIPGVFGAIFTPLLLRRFIRRVTVVSDLT